MSQERTSYLTQCIQEVVDETLELLKEVLEEDYGLGIFEERVGQDELRAEFEAIAQTMDLSEYEDAFHGFVSDYGKEEWDKQMNLRMRRLTREER